MLGCHSGLQNRKSEAVSPACVSSSLKLTRRLVGIVSGETHLGLEVTTVIERIGVEDHQGDIPVIDVGFVDLLCFSLASLVMAQ